MQISVDILFIKLTLDVSYTAEQIHCCVEHTVY